MLVLLEIVPDPASDLLAVTFVLHQSCQPQEVSVLLQNLLSEHELARKTMRKRVRKALVISPAIDS